MTKMYYELTFKVTETLQNGNERRIKKRVLSAPFAKCGKFIPLEARIDRAAEALKAEHYYDIVYLDIKKVYPIIIE